MQNDLWMQRGKRQSTTGPDGKEAWCIALAACFINFITSGIGRSSGILFVNFIDIFRVDRKQASYPIMTRSLTRNLLGPLVGILGQRYGVRCIIFIGGLIAALSSAACFYVNGIFWLTVFWGALSGFGLAMVTTLFQASISEHFVKHKSVAAGMGFSGGCVGSFLFPAVFDSLIDEYGLHGTFLLIGGIVMQVLPAAMILKKPTWLKKRKSIITSDMHMKCDAPMLADFTDEAHRLSPSKNQKATEESNCPLVQEMEPLKTNTVSTSTNFVTNGGIARICKSIASKPIPNKKLDTELLWENRKVIIRLLTNDFTLQCPLLSKDEPIFTDQNINQIRDLFIEIATETQSENLTVEYDFIITKSSEKFNNSPEDAKLTTCINKSTPLQMTDFSQFKTNPLTCLLFFLKQFFERDKHEILLSQSEDARAVVSEVFDELWYIYTLLDKHEDRITYFSFQANHAAGSNEQSLEDSIELENTIYSHIKTALNLYTRPLFILVCLCRCSHFLSFVPMVTIIVDYSRDKGISEDYGVYILAALSAGDLIGRLFFGMLTDREFLSLPKYMLVFMILNGIVTVFLSIFNSILSLTICLFFYGLLQGSVFLQHPVIVSKYLGRHEQSIALGCLNFFSGIIAIFLPNYIGFFRDHLGSYDGMMYIGGGITTLIGSLWFFESYSLKTSQKRSAFDENTNV